MKTLTSKCQSGVTGAFQEEKGYCRARRKIGESYYDALWLTSHYTLVITICRATPGSVLRSSHLRHACLHERKRPENSHLSILLKLEWVGVHPMKQSLFALITYSHLSGVCVTNKNGFCIR